MTTSQGWKIEIDQMITISPPTISTPTGTLSHEQSLHGEELDVSLGKGGVLNENSSAGAKGSDGPCEKLPLKPCEKSIQTPSAKKPPPPLPQHVAEITAVTAKKSPPPCPWTSDEERADFDEWSLASS